LQNQNFIQSEVRLVIPKLKTSKPSNKSKGKGNKGKKQGSGGAAGSGSAVDADGDIESMLEFDYTHIDHHHRALLAACSLCPEVFTKGFKSGSKAGGAASSSSSSSSSLDAARVLVVGLGGGSVTMTLQRYLPQASIDVVELDGQMEALAAAHFKFRPSSRTRVIVAEGMQYMRDLRTSSAANGTANGHLDLIFLDVDSKDPSLALSAPPAAFITEEALVATLGLLKEGGMLAVNVVARGGPRLLRDLAATIRTAGSTLVGETAAEEPFSVYKIQPSDDTVNTLMVVVRNASSGLPGAGAAASTAGGAKKGAGKQQPSAEARLRTIRENCIENWLQV
jgi:predicted O-methyltransferase YrrM